MHPSSAPQPSRRPVVRCAGGGEVRPARLFVRWRAFDRDAAVPSASERFDEGWLLPGSQRIGPFRLRVSVDAEGDVASYEVEIRNEGAEPLWLDAVGLGWRWRGPSFERVRFLRHGWQSWSFAGGAELGPEGEPVFPSGPWLRGFHHALGSPPADRAGWHESDLVTVAAAEPDGPACVLGVLETGHALGVVYLRREDNAVALEAEERFERPLDPGEGVEAEAVRLALGREPAPLLEAHARAHGERAGARVEAPFLAGWCSWYQFFHAVSEDDLLRNLEWLAARREELPVEVVQLDDGYQRAVGDWLETNERFPRGLPAVAGTIRDAGFRAGIWTAPFLVVPESRVFRDHREWLLRREGDELFPGLHHPVWTREGWVYVFDTSQPEVCAHLLRTFAALAGLGFSYFKLDFLYAVAMEARAHDPRLTRAARLRRGLEAIRQGAGEEAYLLGCGCPFGPAVGRVDAMRIGPDVAPYWEPEPSVRIPGLEASEPSARNAIRNVLARAWMHRRLWVNDPDCLLVRSRDTRLDRDERAALAVAVAASGGLVMVSDDLARLGGEEAGRIREVIAIARSIDRAAGARPPLPLAPLAEGGPEGLVVRTHEGAFVALLNLADAPRRFRMEGSHLGLDGARGTPAPCLDSPPAVPRDGEGWEVKLPRHGGALYRLRLARRLAVFCDFDGTFAVQDVGSTLARRYAADRRPELWERLGRGELTAWQYNEELLDGLALPERELEAFLETVELDPGARRLVTWCEERGVPFRILSDGFDRNLDRLQEIHGIRFDYDANRLRYEDGAWRIAPGHPNPDCSCGTGTCKRGRIEAFRKAHPQALVVHIGNGRVSDLCAAEVADVVFAKDSLAEALAERGVHFEPFRTLNDVVDRLEQLWERLGAEG